jgi:hypothetical protein
LVSKDWCYPTVHSSVDFFLSHDYLGCYSQICLEGDPASVRVLTVLAWVEAPALHYNFAR